uniref:Uncharacterized protein n=1 Tax=Eutreptiella gymnastica TaxID=73025 RepID=A0A7S4GIG6_9EUGL
MGREHCTLYTKHFAHRTLRTLYTAQCTLCTAYFESHHALCGFPCTLCGALHCAVHTQGTPAMYKREVQLLSVQRCEKHSTQHSTACAVQRHMWYGTMQSNATAHNTMHYNMLRDPLTDGSKRFNRTDCPQGMRGSLYMVGLEGGVIAGVYLLSNV